MSVTRWKLGAVDTVCSFMRKRGVTLDDLVGIGGEDLKAKNSRKAEKARRVEKCWSLMAQLSVSYDQLAEVVANDPARLVSRRRGEGHSSQAVEIAEVSGIRPLGRDANEISDLADLAPVAIPEINDAALAEGAL